jgi:hypothetical protein
MKWSTRILQIGVSCVLLTTVLQIFVPAHDASFRISRDQSSYRALDKITLKYRITNTSYAPLHVPREWEVTCPRGPQVWARFEDSSGKHFSGLWHFLLRNPRSIIERLSKEAVLLKPREHFDGTFQLDSKLFDLKPGAYRIEATLSGWTEKKFSDAERSQLAQMGDRFMTGDVPDSVRIQLTQ